LASPPVSVIDGQPIDPFARSPPTSTVFDRALDHRILKLGCECIYSRDEASKIEKQIFDDTLSAKVEVDVEGIASDRSFTIRVGGSEDSAACTIRKVLDAQRLGGGEYRRHDVQALGNTKDGSHIRSDLFLNGDENSRMVKTEIVIKKVLNSLRNKYKESEFM